MLKFGHFVSWSFCVIFVFKEKITPKKAKNSRMMLLF